jgi:hypothetical protein
MAKNQRNLKSTNTHKSIGINKNVTPTKKGSGKKKKFKGTRLFKILRIALLLVIIIFIFNVIFDLVHKTPDKITLVIGENTIDLQHDVILDEYNNFYLSLDDIAKNYDANIYLNTDESVITTYNKHIAVLEMNKTTMSINDTVTEINGVLKKINGVVYLPFSDMQIVYDFEYSYNKDEKVLIVDSTSSAKSEVVVLKTGKLKETTKAFAKTLEKVKKSERVTVLGTEGKFTKIRTSSGNIGYIKTKKLAETEVKRENMEEENISNVNILNDYAIVSSNYEVLENSSEDTTQVVMPNLFNINSECSVEQVINLDSTKFTTYKDWATESGVSICPTVTLGASMNKLCSSYNTRTYVINSLYTDIIKNKLNMICIDFETIDDTEGFFRFIIEMMPRFKEAGIKVFVKAQSSINKDRLNSIVDYIVE